MRNLIAALFLLLASTAPAAAEGSHDAAAVELLALMDVQAAATAGTATMADLMIGQNPAMSPYRSVIVEWAEQVFAWENFESRLVAIYTDAFTEDELRELIRFHQSPVGRKLVRLNPELMKSGAQIGAELGREHAPLLDQMIRERAAELENP